MSVMDPRAPLEHDRAARQRRGRVCPVSVAPMMDRTDRHFRRLMRLITRHTLLYTEMVTCPAVLHGDREHILGYHPSEHPLALQLGGDDPEALAACARIAAELGYDEVNINVGCPSDRVQSGNFGVCLMKDPARVRDCVVAMREAVELPVTVKHRIGVDELDRYEDMLNFVDVVAAAEPDLFTVHARKAWLQGLSPKQNRNVPPLRYAEVHRLARERPGVFVEINGGFKTADAIAEQLEYVDAVMLGRAAWDDPWLFAAVDQRFFASEAPAPTRPAVVEAYLEHVHEQLAMARARVEAGSRYKGPSATILLRPIMNLFTGRPGTKRWKRTLNELCQRPTREGLDALPAFAVELEAEGAARDRARAS